MSYAQHPLSAAFPSMADDEFTALVEDIRRHGQRDVATLADGMVIDGWHRYKACQELGIPCRFNEFVGDDAVAFVRSKNQHRRHYQKSQQAAIEVSLTTWADSHRPNKGEVASPFSTNKEMADRAGTTTRTIQHAKRAHEAGLGDIVRDGRLNVEQAAEVAKNPELARKVSQGKVSPEAAIEQVKRPGAKPAAAPAPVSDELAALRAENAELREANAEQGATIKELLEDNNSMAAVFEANDKLTAALDEAKKYREQVRILESRIVGLMNEKNEAVRAAKSWQRKAEKAT